MLPRMCFNFERLLPRKGKKDRMSSSCSSRVVTAAGRGGGPVAVVEDGSIWDQRCHAVLRNTKPTRNLANFSLRAERRDSRSEEIKERKREMANKVSNISHLIHRVATSCLTHHPAAAAAAAGGLDIGDEDDAVPETGTGAPTASDYDNEVLGIWDEEDEDDEVRGPQLGALRTVREMEALMAEVFEAVSTVKRAYVGLQDAHSPWDPDRMRAADAAVVAELRRLGRLRDRFRRGARGGGGGAAPLREAVAPYEAALDELRRDLKARELEVESLKEALRSASTPRSGGGKKSLARLHYGNKVGCITGLAPTGLATPELFESCMDQVKEASKSFTAHLLSLMRAARWDISAAVRSIVEGADGGCGGGGDAAVAVGPGHARHALESYVCRRVFQGFENETFYMEGSLTSLLRPAEFRRDCYSQFRDMRGMDPAELLGVLPTCQFGRFAGKKYLAVVHPRMEESLFGGAEQRRQVVAGAHPRTGFYGEFLGLAKAVWLLHLLAFALDPAPSHFEAGKGAAFHPDYMESVVRFAGGRVPAGMVVGFSVTSGFKLGNGSVVRSRVYLVPPPAPHIQE